VQNGCRKPHGAARGTQRNYENHGQPSRINDAKSPDGAHVEILIESANLTPEMEAEMRAWDTASDEAWKMIDDCTTHLFCRLLTSTNLILRRHSAHSTSRRSSYYPAALPHGDHSDKPIFFSYDKADSQGKTMGNSYAVWS
jgi:hypothetical protein